MTILRAVPNFARELVRVAIRRRTLREIVAFVTLAAVCLALSFAFDGIAERFELPADVFEENGPIETVQAALIGLTAIAYFVASLRFDFELFYGALSLSVLCSLFTLREIPGCASAFYSGGACLSDSAKDGATIATFLVLLATLFLRREPLARRLRDLNLFWLIPVGLAGLILLSGEAMEHLRLEAIEETMETAGYLLLLAFALVINLRPAWFDARLKPFD